MKHMQIGAPARVPLCRYDPSRLSFRGPRRRLDREYIAYLGGAETFGRFLEAPFPALLEDLTGTMSVNLGCVNAGVDAFIKDETVLEICRGAQGVVMEVVGAQNMSNRFYTVHPRRNDRFLSPSTVLQQLFRDVDFSEFTFTRHMLSSLAELDPERFTIVIEELRIAWLARMRSLLQEIGRPVMLFLFSGETSGETLLGCDPLFISAGMLDVLRDEGASIVEFAPSPRAVAQGRAEMRLEPGDVAAAAGLLGPTAHRQAAAHLVGPIRRLLSQNANRPAPEGRPAV